MRVLLVIAIVTLARSIALADPTPLAAADPVKTHPSPVPTASPTSTPRPTPPSTPWKNSLDGFVSLVDQATNGAGTLPPEGPGFANGSPLSPMTPYDTFTSVASTPGVAGLGQFVLTTQYVGKRVTSSLQSGIGYATGSTTNNAYWNESLFPTLNPHSGSQALPYAITFPTGPGQDDGTNSRGSILEGGVAANDGSWQLRGGWFDLAQNDRFVFVQPPLTNVVPSIYAQTAESLGNGPPALDSWPSPPPGLPLQGADLLLHEKSTTFELSNAALPSLPGTSARMTLGSIVLDRGEGTRFSADLLHLATSGDIIQTTTVFGMNAKVSNGPQGPLPSSALGGQEQTIAGLRGAFHMATNFDALVEVGRAWYDANNVFAPGSAKPGGFYNIIVSHSARRATTALEAVRFEPRYATAILPYGAPENIWSVAWSWPGVWLKSTYQLADNTVIGSNRQGYRLRYELNGGPLEIHASYGAYQQIIEATANNVTQTGFVEGFFLPQQIGNGTLGRMHQYAAWVGWHPKIADVTLDYVCDTMHRDFATSAPQDAVTLNAPQLVLAASRRVGKAAIASLGYGRYAMRGSWAQGSFTNVNYAQNLWFAGAQVAESKQTSALIQIRSSAFSGFPSIIGGPPPNFHGSMLIVEQRIHV